MDQADSAQRQLLPALPCHQGQDPAAPSSRGAGPACPLLPHPPASCAGPGAAVARCGGALCTGRGHRRGSGPVLIHPQNVREERLPASPCHYRPQPRPQEGVPPPTPPWGWPGGTVSPSPAAEGARACCAAWRDRNRPLSTQAWAYLPLPQVGGCKAPRPSLEEWGLGGSCQLPPPPGHIMRAAAATHVTQASGHCAGPWTTGSGAIGSPVGAVGAGGSQGRGLETLGAPHPICKRCGNPGNTPTHM